MYSSAAPVGSPLVKKYRSREMGYSPVEIVSSEGATPLTLRALTKVVAYLESTKPMEM